MFSPSAAAWFCGGWGVLRPSASRPRGAVRFSGTGPGRTREDGYASLRCRGRRGGGGGDYGCGVAVAVAVAVAIAALPREGGLRVRGYRGGGEGIQSQRSGCSLSLTHAPSALTAGDVTASGGGSYDTKEEGGRQKDRVRGTRVHIASYG